MGGQTACSRRAASPRLVKDSGWNTWGGRSEQSKAMNVYPVAGAEAQEREQRQRDRAGCLLMGRRRGTSSHLCRLWLAVEAERKAQTQTRYLKAPLRIVAFLGTGYLEDCRGERPELAAGWLTGREAYLAACCRLEEGAPPSSEGHIILVHRVPPGRCGPAAASRSGWPGSSHHHHWPSGQVRRRYRWASPPASATF